MMKLLLGSHISTVGGVHTAFARSTSIGCTTMQVFVKNNNQWRGPLLTDEDVKSYKTAEAKATIAPVLAHAAYLINLCAVNDATLRNSRFAFADELARCEAFGIKALIFHPGAHMGAGERDGIRRVAESLNIVHEKTAGYKVLSALETTAGQGTAIGFRFEHLREIIEQVEERDRMAVCMDTCHLFAAGYSIDTETGWHDVMQNFDHIVGFSRLVGIHVNDSKRERNSRVDRHEHIGKGRIGLTAFRMLMTDPRFGGVPKILETEKSEDMHEDIENMNVLRSLAQEPRSS